LINEKVFGVVSKLSGLKIVVAKDAGDGLRVSRSACRVILRKFNLSKSVAKNIVYCRLEAAVGMVRSGSRGNTRQDY
jgi:hypothetical protein